MQLLEVIGDEMVVANTHFAVAQESVAVSLARFRGSVCVKSIQVPDEPM